MKIVIATKSTFKIEGISEAFREFFPERSIEIDAIKTKSEVPEQPVNDDVYRGAENRVQNAKKRYKENYDFIVSCESGLINQCGNWFNMQIVFLEEKTGMQSWGISNGFYIPEKYVTQIINTSMKKTFDAIFDGEGGISILSKKFFSRKSLIKDATIIALAGTNWPI